MELFSARTAVSVTLSPHRYTEIRIQLVCCFLPQQIAAYFSVIVKIFEHPVNMLLVLVHFTSFHGTVLCPKKCPLQDNCSYTCMHVNPENYFKKTCI